MFMVFSFVSSTLSRFLVSLDYEHPNQESDDDRRREHHPIAHGEILNHRLIATLALRRSAAYWTLVQ